MQTGNISEMNYTDKCGEWESNCFNAMCTWDSDTGLIHCFPSPPIERNQAVTTVWRIGGSLSQLLYYVSQLYSVICTLVSSSDGWTVACGFRFSSFFCMFFVFFFVILLVILCFSVLFVCCLVVSTVPMQSIAWKVDRLVTEMTSAYALSGTINSTYSAAYECIACCA